jgi:hypothetical protein
VQIYPNEFVHLEQSGKIRTIGGDKGAVHFLADDSCYTDVGLEVPKAVEALGEVWFV